MSVTFPVIAAVDTEQSAVFGRQIDDRGGRLYTSDLRVNSYHASVLADYLRRKLLTSKTSFTFETVMSSPDKIELLRTARQTGFRTYLYFVATDDPVINIQRVRNRVTTGGHDVPVEKIVSRYGRSLLLASQAVTHADRAFFFDASGDRTEYFDEILEGKEIKLVTGNVPAWFQPIWKQVQDDKVG